MFTDRVTPVTQHSMMSLPVKETLSGPFLSIGSRSVGTYIFALFAAQKVMALPTHQRSLRNHLGEPAAHLPREKRAQTLALRSGRCVPLVGFPVLLLGRCRDCNFLS